ncbi:MAG: 2-C-methyl-D-erythritol 4-phosphate cytidylyltransferase [Firmicutes bacterium]|nr:2-C-methyl-D-erythritol 4-phosphate cytidylyltransferase [Bacillota bacterium]
MEYSVVVVAAGSGTRMGAAQNKLFLPVAHHPLAYWTLATVAHLRECTQVVLVTTLAERSRFLELAQQAGLHALLWAQGGATRFESVLAGLAALPAGQALVLVHDAARPLASPALFDRVAAQAAASGAALPVIDVRDTVKQVENGHVKQTLDRTQLALAQTPQGFRTSLLIAAMRQAQQRGGTCTDEAQAVEAFGGEVTVVEGERQNLKVTYPEDLRLAEALLGGGSLQLPRVGHGMDVHRFVAGRPLWLGGVLVPYERGLQGHSDGDAVLHAAIDACFGAAGLPDIGRHFPPEDPHSAGISSRTLADAAVAELWERGWRVAQVDITVITEAPAIAPYAAQIRDSVAQVFRLHVDDVSIKAKTAEHLGAVGRGEALVALAIAVLVPFSD